MSKENIVNVTLGNRAKGRINDLGKLAKPSRKEVLLRKEWYTNVISINHMRDQKWNMNFYKSNKGKKFLKKKVLFEEEIRGLQGLKIDKERPSKMSDKIS